MNLKKATAVLAAALLFMGNTYIPVTATDETTDFAGGSGTAEDPWQISNTNQFQAIAQHLDGHYVLTADIDFGGETIEPIGAFVPVGTEGEDAETPTTEDAFSGTFDGDNHKISNYTIEGADDAMGVGLFGCLNGKNAAIENLTVENATITGNGASVGAVIGYQGAPVSEIHLEGKNSISGSGLIGGVAGGSKADMSDCSAVADITMTAENAQGAGILIGGEEGGSVENCTVTGGSVTTPAGSYSVGALVGCFHESAYAKNCSVSDVTVTVGENSFMIGALSGHAGCSGDNKTEISGCSVENVTIKAGAGTERIGGISGGGFYYSPFAEYYPEPCAMEITDCTVTGLKINTENDAAATGLVLGYAYNNSTVENCTADGTLNEENLTQQTGADEEALALSALK